ncbi:DUF3131 domain-containing protein [Paracoccus marcusii]|uniref:DUF3131 domain-containing protein n=1 Tax=Paracoccus marcusii TaxID=59779 RepID=A0ABY7UPF5_9RHOB|nr:DUF3131 domain-containing protein [Paracoccus marcusii]WDA11564.1 DUF3131 domain-containing protein [Paracoccus marcusii]
MRLRQNLVRARGHIVFILGVIGGLMVVTWLEQAGPSAAGQAPVTPLAAIEAATPLPLAIRGASSAADLDHAAIAWTYFRNNTDPNTGLVHSVDGYPSTTMWETGSLIVAIVAAERVSLIDATEAKDRLAAILTSLDRLPLFQDSLPNKAYDTRSLKMVDYANRPTDLGLGWSALDVARLMAALAIARAAHPDMAPAIAAATDDWRLDRMIRDGQLYGASVVDAEVRENQEGRLGYEQYAAKAMMLSGFDMVRAYDPADSAMIQPVMGQDIPVDTRLHRGRTPAFVVSEPYLFDGLEFGFDARSSRIASAVYLAQQARHDQTGHLTAVTETHLDEAPFFAYSTVWGGGAPWSVLTFQGDRIDSRRTLATKAAFGWDALYGTPYTAQLVEAVVPTADPRRGWPEGIYEVDGTTNASITANTNALVLAALAFKAAGPLLRGAP